MMRNLVLISALALAACAQTTAPSSQAAPQMPAEPQSQAACLSAGGAWGPVGLSGTLACTMPSPTAGKVCSDSTECAGQCWSDAAVGTQAKGICQPTNMPFGCHSEVRDGVVQPAMCAD